MTTIIGKAIVDFMKGIAYYTVREASLTLNVSRQVINYHLRKGNIKSIVIGKVNLIPVGELINYKRLIKGKIGRKNLKYRWGLTVNGNNIRKKFYTISEVAKILGLTRQAILKRIVYGKIKFFAVKGVNTYLIPKYDLKKNNRKSKTSLIEINRNLEVLRKIRVGEKPHNKPILHKKSNISQFVKKRFGKLNYWTMFKDRLDEKLPS